MNEQSQTQVIDQTMNKVSRRGLTGVCMLVFVLSILAAGGAFAQSPTKEASAQKSGQASEKPASKSANKANDKKSEKPGDKTSTKEALSGPLTLDEYLAQVSTKHSGYRAASNISSAAKLESAEGALLFRPNLIGQGTQSTDGRENPFDSNRARTKVYSLGVTQLFPFGVSGKVSYNKTDINVPATGSLETSFWNLELSASLSRNLGGRENRAQSEVIEAGALAKSFGQKFAQEQILLEAESNYWRLALARELVQVQKDAVDRATRISDWTGRRVRLQLADRAEGLQASTNLQARMLELRTAEDDERAIRQAFNSSRGELTDKVPEKLTDLTPQMIASLNLPQQKSRRDDVVAAEYQAKATAAQAVIGAERNKPTVELFGATPLNDPTSTTGNPLAGTVPASARPSTTVGIRLSAPLDILSSARAREGYNVEAEAADLTFQRKTFEEERDWLDLASKFRQAKERFQLYADLEKTQKEKLNYERDRQQRGRSTLQQVLIFESDLELAQLGRIRTLAELLTLNAQMKLYTEGSAQ